MVTLSEDRVRWLRWLTRLPATLQTTAIAAVTLQGLIGEVTDIQAKAMADGKYSAAVAALTVKAKLAGLWIDKAENKANNVVYI